VPAVTVPVSPYEQAVEAIRAGNDEALFIALRAPVEGAATGRVRASGQPAFAAALSDALYRLSPW
ncbi:hypothetical protein, partial [Polymorphospora rubra]|uniref:hypothetical protein n=1 Tax=Polymorphospora rubra TaxID=338584 RepID=UPI0033F83929